MKPVRTAARTLLAASFVVTGVRVLLNPNASVATAQRTTDRLAPLLKRIDSRIPTDARTLVRIHAATEVVAGLALATGKFRRPAALVLAASLVTTTATGRSGADLPDSPRSSSVLTNLGVLGGLLLAALDTEGQPGLKYRTSHAVDRSRRSVKRAAKSAKRDARIAALSASAARRFPG